MRAKCSLSLQNVELYDLIAYNLRDIEANCSLNGFSDRLCAHFPTWRKPTGGTLHAHSELGEPRAVRRHNRGPERSWECVLADARRVVSDDDPARRRRVDIYGDL